MRREEGGGRKKEEKGGRGDRGEGGRRREINWAEP